MSSKYSKVVLSKHEVQKEVDQFLENDDHAISILDDRGASGGYRITVTDYDSEQATLRRLMARGYN